jgi:protein involved in polysaccharide export with SLBB domain
LIAPGDILLVQEKEASQTQVQVVGEVLRPGSVAAPADGSVVAVLNAVGGTTPGASLAGASILRADHTLPLNLSGYSDTGQVPGNVRLQPGDTLVVPRNKKQFAVLGAVLRPGLAVYPEDGRLDVMGALLLAGGAGPDADLKSSVILRQSNTSTVARIGAETLEPVTVKVDLSDAFKEGKSSLNIALESGDILYIPTRRGRAVGTGLSQLLSVVPLIGFFVR